MPRNPARLVLAALAAASLAACTSTSGTDTASTSPTGKVTGSPTESASSTTTAKGFPVTVDTPTGEITITKQPTRIVSLSPSATETLFAIHAGVQVVAADEFSTYPKGAPTTKGLSGFEPNLESIAALNPDLVVAATDAGGLVAGMKKLGIPVLLSPAPTTVDGGYDGMAALGLATGHVDETAKVVATMRKEVAAALAKAPKNDKIRVYHELDKTFYSASSASFIGDVYAKMGAVNIADKADPKKTGYPKLTEEAIIAANPQLIVITDQVGYTAKDVAARPGWSKIDAVKHGAIVTVNADIASRWGPRLPQLVTQIATAMNSAKAKA